MLTDIRKGGNCHGLDVMVENLYFLSLIENLFYFETSKNGYFTFFLGELHQCLIKPFLKPSLRHTVIFGKFMTFIGPRMVSLCFPNGRPAPFVSFCIGGGRMRRGYGVWSWFSFHGDLEAYPSVSQGSGSLSGTVMVAWAREESSWSIFLSIWGS